MFLDMDGVLVDFVSSACRVHGKKNPYIDGSNVWEMWKLFGMSIEEFMAPMGTSFWANLNWMPDGRKILEMIEQKYGQENICLLSNGADYAEGKLLWINKHLPKYKKQYLFGPTKWSVRGILIDDYDLNISMHKHPACLVPRPWNSLSHINTIDHIERFLNEH